MVFPLNLNGSSNITTAICEVSSAKKAKAIRYYNTLGTESSHPFKGINIMVTTHTDGTTTAKKSSTNPPHNRATGTNPSQDCFCERNHTRQSNLRKTW